MLFIDRLQPRLPKTIRLRELACAGLCSLKEARTHACCTVGGARPLGEGCRPAWARSALATDSSRKGGRDGTPVEQGAGVRSVHTHCTSRFLRVLWRWVWRCTFDAQIRLLGCHARGRLCGHLRTWYPPPHGRPSPTGVSIISRTVACPVRSNTPPHSQPRALRHVTSSHTSRDTPQIRLSRRLTHPHGRAPETSLPPGAAPRCKK